MVLAAAYVLILVAGAVMLGLLWLAYQGLVYLWRQWRGEEGVRNEAKETLRLIYKGLATLWE